MQRELLFLMGIVFILLGLGTSAGLFRLSIIGVTEQGSRILLFFLGFLALAYMASR